MSTYILGGDIGGTNSRFALFKPTTPENKPDFYKEYSTSGNADPSLAYGGFLKLLDLVLNESLSSQGVSPTEYGLTVVCCFACAGPVFENTCNFSNVIDGKFEVNGAAVVDTFECITIAKVVNDFVGMGYGVLTVDYETECIVVNKGDPVNETGPKACVGAGTGLGECYLTTSTGDTKDYACFASEGGHSDFVPRSSEQFKMFQFIRNRYGCDNRISVERVCSGTGIVNVYDYLAGEYPDRVDKVAHEQIVNGGAMKGKYISMNAKPGSLCEETMLIFATTYGAETGSVAAKFIPTGGIFLTGGLTPKNIKYIEGSDSPFMKAFGERGRLSKLMKSIPVFAVIPEDLGIRGACVCAKKELSKSEKTAKGSSSKLEGKTLLALSSAILVAALFSSKLLKK